MVFKIHIYVQTFWVLFGRSRNQMQIFFLDYFKSMFCSSNYPNKSLHVISSLDSSPQFLSCRLSAIRGMSSSPFFKRLCRIFCLILDQRSLIGFKNGEYGGMNKGLYPQACIKSIQNENGSFYNYPSRIFLEYVYGVQ